MPLISLNPATVLADVIPGMPAYDEELFGPVAAIITARDEADAVRIAHDTPYGLGTALFSRGTRRARELAHKHLAAGMVFANDQVRSDASLPFGGIKDSGLGRELASQGLLSFVNVKTLWIT